MSVLRSALAGASRAISEKKTINTGLPLVMTPEGSGRYRRVACCSTPLVLSIERDMVDVVAIIAGPVRQQRPRVRYIVQIGKKGLDDGD